MGLCAIICFLVLFVSKASKGQSTSTLCSTCSAALTCKGCNINAEVLTLSSISWVYGDPAIGTPYLNAILVFTEYTVITTTSHSGNCATHTKTPVSLKDGAYSAQLPGTFIGLASSPTGLTPSHDSYLSNLVQMSHSSFLDDTYSSFLDDTYSSFLASEGLGGCTALIPPSQILPTYVGEVAEVSGTAAPSTTASSTAGHQVHHTETIILSVLLPTAGLMVLLICVVILRRYRKKRSHQALRVQPKISSDTQIYLDRKAELEDEERRRHELDGGGKVHEMDGQDTLFEMPGNDKSRMNLASPHKMQELRGLEPSQELEVPSNV